MAKLQPLSTVNRIIFFFVGVMLIASWKNEQPNYYEISGDSFALLPELQKPINAFKPDYSLLDAAIFHATNNTRKKFGLKPFEYALGLHRTTESFAKDMINMDFYGHTHPYSPALATLSKRIEIHTWAFNKTAENIGQYPLINTAPDYCCRRKRDGNFEYFDCKTKELFLPYTYEGFAQLAIEKWMNSPPHRRNILDTTYTHLGSAARISKDSYKACRAPFGRFDQNFGRLKTL